jgi:hypothetical protein
MCSDAYRNGEYAGEALSMSIPGPGKIGRAGKALHALEDAGKAGKVYRVPGSKTPSGRPYIGRTKQPSPASRGSRDGRDRSDAEIVDTNNPEDADAGRAAEQGAINREGGVPALDNKRNEVDPSRWDELGIDR